MVGYPDINGREAILKVHAREKPLSPDVKLRDVAKQTAGFTGADLANLLNEAALLAARKHKKAITQTEIEEAAIKVVVGSEKKSKVMSDREKKLTAYHEAGHAICFYSCETQDPVHQISIIPRGMAGGYTMPLPTEDRSYRSKREMEEEIIVDLGGRVAEALVLGDISTGASGDIQQASSLARDMVMKYGMSDRLGPISYDSSGHSIFIGRDFGQTKSYSEETAGMIDEEVKKIFDEAAQRCEAILSEHAEQLSALAEYLLAHETIEKEAFDHFFETGQFPAEDPKLARQARNDSTIERPARKISMIDGYAEEAKEGNEAAPAEEAKAAEEAAPETPAEAETPATEPPKAPKDE
jgi:cell division protease FtsH